MTIRRNAVGQMGRHGAVVVSLTGLALLVRCGGKVEPSPAEAPRGTTQSAVTGSCTAELESIAPAGGQTNPALGATLVAKSARCMSGTPARYRFVVTSPNTGTSLVACDWQLGRTCRWNTASLVERGLWKVQVETVRDGYGLVDGRSSATSYAVGGICRVASVASTSPTTGSGQPGTPVAITVSGACDAGLTPEYAVFATSPAGAVTQVGAWSSSSGPFSWSTTGLPEGRYTLEARVRQAGSKVDYEANGTASYVLGRYVCDGPVATAGTSGTTRAIAVTSACTAGSVPTVRFTRRSPSGVTSVLQDWSTATSYGWNVSGLNGTWRVLVEVRAQQTPTQVVASTTVRQAVGAACTATPSGPLSGASPIVAPAGSIVTLASSESGCSPELKYQVQPSTSADWTTVCDWSTSTTCALYGGMHDPGVYAVRTLARMAGSTEIDSESVTSPVTLILDVDSDGDHYSIANGDCHDRNAAVHPGAAEVCNGFDDNCDGNVDEGVSSTYYVDADGDGYGDASGPLLACSAPSGFVTNATDCDDTLASVRPGAPEICGNAIDENCDGLAPACSGDGGTDAGGTDAGTDAGTTCTPNATTCSGTTMTVCASDGSHATTQQCSLGCGATACRTLTPSNLPANTCDVAGLTDLTVTGSQTLNTALGCDAIVTQGGGAPDICVHKYRNISITGTLVVNGPRAIALVATGSFTLYGTLDASATNASGGPGASDTRGFPGPFTAAGAGHATPGGAAGAFVGETASPGGAAYGTVDGVPLLAGASGGNGSVNAAGGAGGGALQLVGCGTFDLGGTNQSAIHAWGGGGKGGEYANGFYRSGSGGGGGSGGTVLIEAAHVVENGAGVGAAAVQAWGAAGGGGGGAIFGGWDGLVTGGAGGKDGGGAGGDSTVVNGAPGAGNPGSIQSSGGHDVHTAPGGGAGANGVIRINTGDGATPVLKTSFVPAPTFGSVRTH